MTWNIPCIHIELNCSYSCQSEILSSVSHMFRTAVRLTEVEQRHVQTAGRLWEVEQQLAQREREAEEAQQQARRCQESDTRYLVMRVLKVSLKPVVTL